MLQSLPVDQIDVNTKLPVYITQCFANVKGALFVKINNREHWKNLWNSVPRYLQYCITHLVIFCIGLLFVHATVY